MKLKFIDWEVEQEYVEDYWGCHFRYELEEIIREEGHKCHARNLVYTDDFSDICQRIGEIILYGDAPSIEYVENESLKRLRNRQTIK